MPGIYVHVPFCKSRCIYCDFFSTTMLSRREEYVDAVCKEIELRKDFEYQIFGGRNRVQRECREQSSGSEDLQEVSKVQSPKSKVINTIYFGGGTPSQLTISQLERILEKIFSTFNVSADAEITIEANPDDVTVEFADSIAKLPFNRVSLGIQTFDDASLRQLNRRHTAAKAIEAVKLLQKRGFDNISIDLIYGLPNQTLQQWDDNVKTALQLGVQHISAYSLMYEEGTRLFALREANEVAEADEELSLNMFRLLMERLAAAGFEHYEISNFALPGRRSRHNSSYWNAIPYLGFGAGAHSFDGSSRQWNASNLDAYIRYIQSQGEGTSEETDGIGSPEKETLTETQRFEELIMTRLRTCEGIDLCQVERDFGKERRKHVERMAAPYLASGQLKTDEKKTRISLTREGIFISNSIIADLFV